MHQRIIQYPEEMRALIFDLDGTLVDTVTRMRCHANPAELLGSIYQLDLRGE
jgi:phosphoglycolate phosphatase-like HAD superfamily hydrolase